MKGFTIDYWGDNFNNDPLLLKCVERSKEIFGEENFKIYTKEDAIVKEAEEKYKFIFDKYFANKNGLASVFCDFIKLYILSKSEDTLYLDSDVYILDNELPKETSNTPVFEFGCFNIIYSGYKNQSEIFEKILQAICTMYEEAGHFLIDYQIMDKYKDLFVQKAIVKSVHFAGEYFRGKRVIILDTNSDDKILQVMNGARRLNEISDNNYVFIYNSNDDSIPRYTNVFLNKKNVVSNEWLYEYLTLTAKRFERKDKSLVKVVKL